MFVYANNLVCTEIKSEHVVDCRAQLIKSSFLRKYWKYNSLTPYFLNQQDQKLRFVKYENLL